MSPEARVCCGANNRGLAILGSTLFMGTLDGHLVAIDAVAGRPLWNVAVGDPALGYSITMAPLAVKDKILVGVGGGEYGIRGFVAAFDPASGKELWRFYTVPGPGERGHETWKRRRVEDGRRFGVAHAVVRPGAQPDLLGHRQPGTRLERRAAARRQPLHRLGRSRSTPTPAR